MYRRATVSGAVRAFVLLVLVLDDREKFAFRALALLERQRLTTSTEEDRWRVGKKQTKTKCIVDC